MEVGALRCDGIPTDEMRNGQIVATLIDVASGCQSVEAAQFVLEEYGDGQTQGKFPFRGLNAGVEWLRAKRCPTVNALHDFCRSRLALIAVLTGCYEELARTVAFKVIIDTVLCIQKNSTQASSQMCSWS